MVLYGFALVIAAIVQAFTGICSKLFPPQLDAMSWLARLAFGRGVSLYASSFFAFVLGVLCVFVGMPAGDPPDPQ